MLARIELSYRSDFLKSAGNPAPRREYGRTPATSWKFDSSRESCRIELGLRKGCAMEIARHWRLKQQRYSLVGAVCPHCEHKIFPPRGVCPNCGQETIAGHASKGPEKGEIMVPDYKTVPALTG